MSLEECLDSEKRYDPALATRFRKYAVDVCAGWAYYLPTFALGIEAVIGGMEPAEIYHSRLMASAVHAAIMRPVGFLRNYLPKKFGVTEESPQWKKSLIDLGSVAAMQIPVYIGILSSAGVDLSEPRKQAMIGASFAFTYLTAPVFGRFMDWWRDLHGIEPAMYPPRERERDTWWNRAVKAAKGAYGRLMARDVLRSLQMPC